MTLDLQSLTQAVTTHGAVARVVIVATAGSAPRGTGTSMLVWPGGQSGTIGGGALELEAAKRALTLAPGASAVDTWPLGPGLGQCCGGSVTTVTECFDINTLPQSTPFARAIGPSLGTAPLATDTLIWQKGWLVEPEIAPQRRLWIYGAGHVGRALVATLAPLPDFQITWVDTSADRFPSELPPRVDAFVAVDPARAAMAAPVDAEHLVLTYSHAMDLDVCHAILSRPFRSAGLIGSATKWARFRKRLTQLGHADSQISRIACPIGDPNLGKHPQQIAIGVAMALLHGMEHVCQEGTG